MSRESPEGQAWALLLAARELADDFTAGKIPEPGESVGFYYKTTTRQVDTVAGQVSDADLIYTAADTWRYSDRLHPESRDVLDLYLPVLGTRAQPSVTIGHLGQSIDARIATTGGDAFFVTGEQNRKHLHRLRALCHCVVIGAQTAISDNPQLTVRAVSGRQALRIIIDPKARVPATLGLLQDEKAPTWLLHGQDVDLEELPAVPGGKRLRVPCHDGSMQPRDILAVLARHGIHRVFIEGGGVSVSQFLGAQCLTRLHVAAAPVIVGDGIPALNLPGAASMQSALRPPFYLYRMGLDVLWDFQLDLHEQPAGSTQQSSAAVAAIVASRSVLRLL